MLGQAQHVKVSARVSFSPHDGPSTLLVVDVERLVVEGGFTSMLAEDLNGQQALLEPWKNMCLSGMKR